MSEFKRWTCNFNKIITDRLQTQRFCAELLEFGQPLVLQAGMELSRM
jgi:hypothetical protein